MELKFSERIFPCPPVSVPVIATRTQIPLALFELCDNTEISFSFMTSYRLNTLPSTVYSHGYVFAWQGFES